MQPYKFYPFWVVSLYQPESRARKCIIRVIWNSDVHTGSELYGDGSDAFKALGLVACILSWSVKPGALRRLCFSF